MKKIFLIIMVTFLTAILPVIAVAQTKPTFEVYQVWDDGNGVISPIIKINTFGSYYQLDRILAKIESSKSTWSQEISKDGQFYKSGDSRWKSSDGISVSGAYKVGTVTVPEAGNYYIKVGVSIGGTVFWGDARSEYVKKNTTPTSINLYAPSSSQFKVGDPIDIGAVITKGSEFMWYNVYVKKGNTTIYQQERNADKNFWYTLNTKNLTADNYTVYVVSYKTSHAEETRQYKDFKLIDIPQQSVTINSFATNKSTYYTNDLVIFSGSASNFGSWKIVWLKNDREADAATSIQQSNNISYSGRVNGTEYNGAVLYVYPQTNGGGAYVTKKVNFTVKQQDISDDSRNTNGIYTLEIPIQNFQIKYFDKLKNNGNYDTYFNLGYFAECSGTLPVANLVCDIENNQINDDIKKRKIVNNKLYSFCNDGTYGCGAEYNNKFVSTLVIDQNGAHIAQYNKLNDNVKYAVSGAPIILKGQKVLWNNAKTEGWGLDIKIKTWHGLLTVKNGKIIYIALESDWDGIYDKIKNYGYTDVIQIDGGGSFIYKKEGKIIKETLENRRINNIGVFSTISTTNYSTTPTTQPQPQTYNTSNFTKIGNAKMNNYSGRNYIGEINSTNGFRLSINSNNARTATFSIIYRSDNRGGKLLVNGVTQNINFTSTNWNWGTKEISGIQLRQGANTIEFYGGYSTEWAPDIAEITVK